jgi:hypothetical protein
MASANDIVNMAIAQVGGDLVEDYTDTDDTSLEAVLARLLYPVITISILEMYDWPFAYNVVDATTVEATVAELDDDTEFTHRIARGADWYRVLAVSEDGTFEDRVHWRVSEGYVYTQAESFSIKYIDEIAEANWPNSFVMAVVSYLAWKLSFPLTKSKEVQKAMQQQFAVDIELAQEADDFHAPMGDTTNNARVVIAR